MKYIWTSALAALLITSTALAAGENTANESGIVLSAVQRNPNAVLHRPEHADREKRVVGIVNGMVNKLMDLSERLENQLAQAKQGSSNTANLETATRDAQRLIAATIQALQTIPESDKPSTLIPEIREQLLMLRTKIEAVRQARIAL